MKTMDRRQLLALTAAVFAFASAGVFAQGTYPTQTLKIIVPFTPGTGMDTIARVVAPRLSERLGQSVVVQNQPGASGNIGAEAVAKSAPDGYTVLMGANTMLMASQMYKGVAFDPVKDFTPLTMVSTSPSMLVAHPKVPANNVNELIALAKSKPGQLNFAIGALGSSLHMAGDAFKMKSGAYIVNIPYRGTAPAVQDVLAGQVELMFAAIGNVQSHIKAGKLKALGVTSAKRLAAFPDVPSIGESLPGYESSAWFGLFGPGRMSPEVSKRLADAARAAVQSPEVKRRIEHEGATPVGNSPEEFARFVDSEIVRWRAVVQYAGAKPE